MPASRPSPASLALALAALAAACGGSSAPAPPPRPATATAARAEAPTLPATAPIQAAAAIEPEPPAPAAPRCAPLDPAKLAPPELDATVVKVPVPAIEDPTDAMAPLWDKLAAIARGEARDHVRVAFYGDSNMTRDYITGAMRRVLQGRFGDAGHGFVALSRPWGWYAHMDVRHGTSGEKHWRYIATSTHYIRDHLYGFANIGAESSRPGASAWVQTAEDGAPVGAKVSAFDLLFLTQPYGGQFEILVDDQVVRTVSTRAGANAAGFERVEVPDGPHKLSCRVKGYGPVRLFGAALERAASPSVVVDSLGVGALNYEQMLHVEGSTRRAMLAHRKYDLVVFLLGTNMFAPHAHEEWVKGALADFRAALPGVPVLLMSPPDSGVTNRDWTSNPRIEKLAIQMREIARTTGAAYWDFWAAMGGKGSIRRFMENHLAENDCVHLSPGGGQLMGARFAHALLRGAEAHAKATPDAGCPR